MSKRIVVLLAAATAVWLAPFASADQGQGGQDQTPAPPVSAPTVTVMTTPPAAPGPVVNTGGNMSSSNPGSGCSERLGTRNVPVGPSVMDIWSQSGDSGWPFGWPGMAPANAMPTTAASVGCSR